MDQTISARAIGCLSIKTPFFIPSLNILDIELNELRDNSKIFESRLGDKFLKVSLD